MASLDNNAQNFTHNVLSVRYTSGYALQFTLIRNQ